MIEILVSIAGKVAEYAVDPFVRQLGYVYNYRTNADKLLEKVEQMKDMINRHQRCVGEARRNGHEIEEDVSRWLTIVDGFIRDVGDFVDDYQDKKKTSCFKGSCPNLKSRYLLGRESSKKVVLAERLIQQGSNFGRLTYLPSLKLQPRSCSEAGLESRTTILNAIMEVLAGDAKVNRVGVWGLGGVGKSTLVNQIAQQADEKRIFDKVITATVLQTPNYNEIQQLLAEQLDFQFVESTQQARAARLHERIVKEEKTILIILDDLWEGDELHKIGVPSPEDDHKGCKLLLTSRDRDVLTNQMGTQKEFKIEQLSDDEASILFMNTAGGDSIKHPEFESLATDLVAECGGLPIAIVTVATALKNKSLNRWKDALLQLRKGTSTTIPGMETKVYKSLRLSYDYLESDEIKSFFLLFGLIPYNYIDTTDLLKYGMGLRLFDGIDTLEDARNREESLVDMLKASNLLLPTRHNAILTMHNLIRNVAIEIASTQHHMRTLQKPGVLTVEEWPKMDDLRMFTMRDLVVTEFPEQPVCPNLELLGCYDLNLDSAVKIPDTFFNGMKHLNVLDLSRMHLPSLPSSLKCLTNLRTLCLDGCKLGGNLGLVVELKALEILSLMDSDIEELPKAITGLTRLRLLDLKSCSKLQVIPADVIASLTRLENLCMENSFTQWEMEGNNNACVDELQHLPNLTYLDVQIPSVQLLPKGFALEKLERYRIFIGESWGWEGNFETNKTLKLNHLDIDVVDDGIIKLLKRSEDVSLSRFRADSANFALSTIDREGFPKLKRLQVGSTEKIRYVMNSLESIHPQHSAFPVLEKLILSELSNLEQVCHGQFPAGSFGCLRKIKVEECHTLKYLFSMTMAKGLSKLEGIQVTKCDSMDNVVAQGSQQELIQKADDDVSSLFPKLRKLKLHSLPKLHGFCFNGTPRLQHADLDSASPVLLFDGKVTFPRLEELSISGLNHMKRIWDIQLPHHSFSDLTYVLVADCEELVNIFPPYMLRWLQRLQILGVRNCDSLQEVFDMEGGGIINNVNEEVAAATVTLLSRLLCVNLPKVKQIWNEGLNRILSFRNLKSVTVLRCPSLKSLFPAALVGDLQQLQELNVVHCCGIEEIVAEADKYRLMKIETEPMRIVFPKLTSLRLKDLHQLKSFYAGPHISRWPSLKELEVGACHQATSLFASAAATASTAQDHEGSSCSISTTRQPQPVAFPCLEMLTLTFNDHITDQLWQEQFRVDFPTLRELRVTKYHHISVVLPPLMLQRLHNLERLRVVQCDSVKEIFQLEGLDVKKKAMWLGCLREIDLRSLPELTHICRGNDSDEEPAAILELKSLKNLYVGACESLKLLFPRAVSFQNLQGLYVRYCGGLRSLMSASIVKTLVNLKTLEIVNSQRMEQVVEDSNGGDESGDENEIAFAKLETMKLRYLPNLTSFYSGRRYIFSFPSLNQLKVNVCPKMKIFSSGNVVTPMLKSIRVTKYESYWEGDINTTIHELFTQAQA